MNAYDKRVRWQVDVEDAWPPFEAATDEGTRLETLAYLLTLVDTGEPTHRRLIEPSSDIYVVDLPPTARSVLVRMTYVPRRRVRNLTVRRLWVPLDSHAL